MAKSKKPLKSRNSLKIAIKKAKPRFLNSDAKGTFYRLRLAFTKALILQYFDPECHIWIKTNASSYASWDLLSQIASGTRPDKIVTRADLCQLILIAFILMKIILAETWYKPHKSEFLAIFEIFKHSTNI